MFIWQYVDLDPEEVNKIKEKYLSGLPPTHEFYQTLNLGITKFIGRPVFKTVLITQVAYGKGVVHKDFRPHDNNVLAINIPLINCENSVTEFWESDEDNKFIQFNANRSPYISFDKAKCKKIDEFKLTQPILFRTDIPHSLSNYSNKPRLGISIRLATDPWDLVSVS
jgi:hypothetical protein